MKSFANGTAFTLKNTAVREQVAFDPKLTHNKVIGKRGDDMSTIIYSIDPNTLLKTLNLGTEDSLHSLERLTLATKSSNEGEAMWDTLFNFKNRESTTACVLMADESYLPIGPHDTISSAKYLNLSMAISRVSLNRVRVNDKIGIAINDMMSQSVYVLLYHVHSATTTLSKETDKDGRAGRVAAVNVELRHAMQINYAGEVSLEDMNENIPYHEAGAEDFVGWLFNAVMDIETAYPYKPHFSPAVVRAVKRPVLEDRLMKQKDNTTAISYSMFEDMCRTIYMGEKDENRKQRERNRPAPTQQRNRKPQNAPSRDLPIVEIVTLQDHMLVNFLSSGFDATTYCVQLSEVDEVSKIEYFLTNQDLKGVLLGESSKVVLLNEDKFGKNAMIRYFHMNF